MCENARFCGHGFSRAVKGQKINAALAAEATAVGGPATLCLWLLILWAFSRRGQQARARAKNSAVGPLGIASRVGSIWGGACRSTRAFAKENLSHTRLGIEPARQQAQLVFEFTIALRQMAWLHRGCSALRRRLEPLAQNLLDRA